MEIDKLNGKMGEKSLLKRMRKTKELQEKNKLPKIDIDSDIGTFKGNETPTYQITSQRTIYFPFPPPKVIATEYYLFVCS